uniref:Uncharacterized protein n=1 Tax=Romanomermis culicivorax TaxID=13658 RepID=A0A915IY41_ROMCU
MNIGTSIHARRCTKPLKCKTLELSEPDVFGQFMVCWMVSMPPMLCHSWKFLAYDRSYALEIFLKVYSSILNLPLNAEVAALESKVFCWLHS